MTEASNQSIRGDKKVRAQVGREVYDECKNFIQLATSMENYSKFENFEWNQDYFKAGNLIS